MADWTGIRIGTCLINRWRVRINREGLYNVKAYVPKKGGTSRLPNHGVLNKENNKNMKLLGRGLGTEATQDIPEKSIVRHVRFTLVQIAMKTMTNCCLVNKA